MGKIKSIGLVSIAGFIVLAITLGVTLLLGQERITELFEPVAQKDTISLLLTTALLSLAMSVGLPRQIAAFTCGYFLGWHLGFLIALLAAIIGCMITVNVAHFGLHTQVKQVFPEKSEWLHRFFKHDTFLKALIIRLIPAGSNFITNVIAGSVNVPIKAYLLGTFIGFIPQMLVFSLLGNGVQLGQMAQIWISIIMLFVALCLSAYLMKKSKIGKEIKRRY